MPSKSAWRAAALAAGLCLHGVWPAAAQNAAADLAILDGRTLRFVITGNAGGGTDRYARTFIEGLQSVLPNTQILAQNSEGGGGTLALIEAQDQRGDMINLVVTHTTPVFTQMLGSELSSAFDLNQFHWIGALANNQRILVVRTTIGDPSLGALAARERPLVGPVETARSAGDIELRLVDATTDLEIELVPGVEDALRDSLILAGNADLAAGNYLALKTLIEAGAVVPLLRFGLDGYPAEIAASVPTLGELVRPGASPVVVGMLDTLNKLGRMILAAPQNDPAIVGALRLAFDRTVAAPGLAETFASRNLLLAPTGGEELAAGIAILLGDAEAQALLGRYLECSERTGADEASCLGR